MANMQYVEIPYVEKPVSRIFYGTAAHPFMEGGDGNELLDSIFATGVNAFDTARVYQLSEKSLGKWIADRGNREEIVVLSKCGHPSPFGKKRINEKDIRKTLSASADARSWPPKRTAPCLRSPWHGSLARI